MENHNKLHSKKYQNAQHIIKPKAMRKIILTNDLLTLAFNGACNKHLTGSMVTIFTLHLYLCPNVSRMIAANTDLFYN